MRSKRSKLPRKDTREKLYSKPLSSLYKMAQRYFNAYIRQRDVLCITCGKPTQEAGHFQHGGNNKYNFWVDFNEKNLNGQCTICNHYMRGNLNIYSEKLIAKYNSKIIAKLNALKWKNESWDRDDLIDIIIKYKKKITIVDKIDNLC